VENEPVKGTSGISKRTVTERRVGTLSQRGANEMKVHGKTIGSRVKATGRGKEKNASHDLFLRHRHSHALVMGMFIKTRIEQGEMQNSRLLTSVGSSEM